MHLHTVARIAQRQIWMKMANLKQADLEFINMYIQHKKTIESKIHGTDFKNIHIEKGGQCGVTKKRPLKHKN
ncbi:hypothetical protein FGO68_gene6723 [Halteria grandinella]|uniref:Uncharacterized protein n=1 Tax=Halteria grandinella TaxID=5974 RepID=A0A8J8N9N6_HALGN|nr:hypothetical protein FGO68_gene6723 [Halteria grandinella]